MRPPRIPPMLSLLVQTGLSAMDGVEFTKLDKCPQCGGTVAPHDLRKRQFARLIIGNSARAISVYIKRFHCRNCHMLCYADGPFYPGMRIGSPVVDLCTALAVAMPPNRVAAYLEAMGVVVDRTSCRLIANARREIKTMDLFGMRLPLSVFALSTLATGAGKGARIEGAEALAACGLPPTDRAPLHLPPAPNEGNVRNKQEEKEGRNSEEPEADRDRDRSGKQDQTELQ